MHITPYRGIITKSSDLYIDGLVRVKSNGFHNKEFDGLGEIWNGKLFEIVNFDENIIRVNIGGNETRGFLYWRFEGLNYEN